MKSSWFSWTMGLITGASLSVGFLLFYPPAPPVVLMHIPAPTQWFSGELATCGPEVARVSPPWMVKANYRECFYDTTGLPCKGSK